MAKKKVVNLDKEKFEEVKIYKLKDIPEIPVVFKPPVDWPPLFEVDGESWYQKALLFEQVNGIRVLPIQYKYDDDMNIIDRPQEEIDQIRKDNAWIYERK